MNDSLLPQDPLRSLVDTSLEDDEIDDYYDDDDGDNTPTPKHAEKIQTSDGTLLLEQHQRRQEIPIPNPTIITTLPTTSHHRHRHQHPYFSSLASNTSHSSNNAVPITPLHYIPYVHGGYSAAAPLFVTNSKFAYILKKLLPGAYEELSILLRACEINGGATAAAAATTTTTTTTTGHRGHDDDVEASSGEGGRKYYYSSQQGTNNSNANHCDNNFLESTNLDIMINNTTLNTYNNAMNQTEKRFGRPSSPTVTTKISSSFLLLHNMKDETNTIPDSAGIKAAAETAQVILADPVKSK